MARPKSKLPDYIREVNTPHGLRWSRKCPTCKLDIIHKTLPIAKMCYNKNRSCQKCGCPWSKGLTTNTSESLRKLGMKVSKSMKEYRKLNPPWNKGLTKESSNILRVMGEKHIGFSYTNSTKKLISDYSKKLWKNKKYREKCLRNFTDYNEKRLSEIILKYGTCGERNKRLSIYYKLVWTYTNKNKLESLENYDKWIDCGYHLDHRYSMIEGFENGIGPEIIGSIHNIQFIPSHDNQVKSRKCSITKNELLLLYESKNKI